MNTTTVDDHQQMMRDHGACSIRENDLTVAEDGYEADPLPTEGAALIDEEV
jgi:hypothetical protein